MFQSQSNLPYTLDGIWQMRINPMKNIDLNYIYWRLGRVAKSLTVWGLLGLAIALVSLAFYLTKVAKIDREIQLAQSQLEHRPIQLEEPTEKQTHSTQTSAAEVMFFYKIFPAGDSLPKWLSMIEISALKQHLVLNRGDYKLTQTKQGQISSYEIVLPVSGKYIEIRQFIAEVLQKLPALALSDLQIKRENSLSPTVEARLVFQLFLQGDSW
jgi:hypothetical protein